MLFCLQEMQKDNTNSQLLRKLAHLRRVRDEKMTNTYPKNAKMEVKMYEELRCIRCALERILNAMDSSAFVDYEMEKFGKVR